MKWHDQVTSLTLRLYKDGNSYENKDKYIAVVQAELLGDDTAYLHAALKSEKDITITEWYLLAQLLHEKYGVITVEIERKGKKLFLDAARGVSKLRE